MTPTRTIRLDFDNIADYMPLDFAESLVRGVVKRDLDAGDALVRQLREWVESYADHPGARFTVSPFDAELILEYVAGWRED